MMPKNMQAIVVHDYGGSEVLILEKVTRPGLKAGEVLIRTKVAAVNPADWKRRDGMYRQFMPLQFPWIPGLEGSGIVEEVGPEVTTLRKGQEVFGFFVGAYAEYTATPATDVRLKPAHLSFEQAASVSVGALTAWQAVEVAGIQPGQRVLVHGAAGGVGLFVVQLACWKGAKVTGTASMGNLDFVRSLGAENALDYKAAPFETVLHDLDVVIDTVGGDLTERSFKVLRKDGVYVTVAGRLAPDAGKAQRVRALSAGRASPDHLSQVTELLEAKKITPFVGAHFPLAEARKAHELSQTGHGYGRIILEVS